MKCLYIKKDVFYKKELGAHFGVYGVYNVRNRFVSLYITHIRLRAKIYASRCMLTLPRSTLAETLDTTMRHVKELRAVTFQPFGGRRSAKGEDI